MSADHLDGRRLRYQHRRPELLDAVVGHVLANGLAGLSMRPLAAAVGVSHGTLLHHFGTKENLVTEVIGVLRGRLADAAGLTGAPPVLADLPTWWQRSTTTDRLPVYRLLFEVFAKATREPEHYGQFLQQVVHDSLALVEDLVVREGCPRERAPAIASMIVAQARGLQLELLATDDRARADRAFTEFLGLVDGLARTWR